MRQDKNQPETQTSENITEYGTEACIPAEAKQEHSDPSAAGSTSSERDDNNPSGPIATKSTPPTKSAGNSSGSANAKNASPKKGDSDSKEWVIWECVSGLLLVIMALAVIGEILFLLEKGYCIAVVFSFVEVVLVLLLYLCLHFQEKEIQPGDHWERLKSFIKEHIKGVVYAICGSILLVYVVVSLVSGIDANPFVCVLFLASLFFIGFAGGGTLFCWEVKKKEDARERAMGVATVASVLGFILAITTIFVSNQTPSDCVCESCSSNEALTETYQDEPYSG